MYEFKVKFAAEHIGEAFVTQLVATCDCRAYVDGAGELNVTHIIDPVTHNEYLYSELHPLDVAELHRRIAVVAETEPWTWDPEAARLAREAGAEDAWIEQCRESRERKD